MKDCIQSNSLSVGNLQLIGVLAGHADIKTTMKYYAQADKEQRERAAAVMAVAQTGRFMEQGK